MKRPDEYTLEINNVTFDPDHFLGGVKVELTYKKQTKKVVLIKKSDWDDLEKRAGQLATHIQGMILCLQEHGTNINPAFLIDHYETVLKKYRGEK